MENIDLSKPMKIKKVIGFNKNKRRCFNTLMSDIFDSVESSTIKNEIYFKLHKNVLEQNDFRVGKLNKEEKIIQFVDEKIFKK